MRTALLAALLAAPALAQTALAQTARQDTAYSAPPVWTRTAVWYQVFPERFRNGDPSNDPTPESMTGSWPQVGADSLRAVGWRPTPWGHDWYRQEPWAEAAGEGFYFPAQLRRYGGDLQGVLDKLPYLDALGVTALYFNPLNWSPSLHKYDARDYRHVDPHFGPDPAGDERRIAAESLTDPETWTFTAADSLFLLVIRRAHDLGMKVVLDYSWNHTGTQHPAFQRVLAEGRDSPFAVWYRIDRFDDPATPDTSEFAYTGWAGVRELPELRKLDLTGDPHAGVPYDGTLVTPVRDHVFAVSRRWLDPDGDGDPSDGVDGFRLDVAEMVPLGFWRQYREVVKAVNPEAYLVGEIWWQQWPTTLMDPRPYLGVFDAVMNYRPYRAARSLFAGAPPRLTPSQFARHVDSLYAGIPDATQQAMMNTMATHDSPRLVTSLANAHLPYKTRATPREDSAYVVARPDAAAQRTRDLVLVWAFTGVGAPHVYYGDEAGMWGADDPDNRKPMVWADLAYEPETALPSGAVRAADSVAVDEALLERYRALIALRQAHPEVFATGAFEWVLADDARGLLAFRRTGGGRAATVVFNLADREQAVVGYGGALAYGVGGVGMVGEGLVLSGRAAAVLVE